MIAAQPGSLEVPAAVASSGPVSVIVVSFESEARLDPCLASLEAAAPRRGLDVHVVDNASADDSVLVATRRLGAGRVHRLAENRGFPAGVNAGLARAAGSYVAVLNPDTIVLPGCLDRLADELDRHARAGLVAPRVVGAGGRPEASVGHFPSGRRERNHALGLHRLARGRGRTRPFPDRTARVDWASGCAWLLRAAAARDVGPMDEGFFMYFDDVDYCRRLWAAGWAVLASPSAHVVHATGQGSRATAALPAEGGASPLRYFAKHLPREDAERARRWLLRGWRLRAIAHGLGGRLGLEGAAARAARFDLALSCADAMTSGRPPAPSDEPAGQRGPGPAAD
jgi:GT2 family glycosyltransferase